MTRGTTRPSLFKKGGTLLSIVLSGIILAVISPGAGAQKGDFRLRQFLDSRHNHNRPYPAPGQFMEILPHGHRVVFWGKERYHFLNGVWYRPIGRQFLVVPPPVGITVPLLPPFHTTFWVNGVPYYYANEVYYTQSPVGYVVAERPKGEISQTPPGKQLFIYPRQNQSARIQETDRRECQTWALNQTKYNPDKPPANMTEAQKNQGPDAYQRALGACLEARGYVVK
ncbi:MAG: hypothetical protein HY787_18605 [Deltaproteobacteria bacterium]|nr:hypothetical protein [Deltaproteobacteria bacterium]